MRATMKDTLHEEYINVDHEVSLDRITYDLFNDMYLIASRAARYGLKSVKLMLCDLPTYRWIPSNCEKPIKDRLFKLLQSEDLIKSFTPGGIYELTWAKESDRIPMLRASDLIEAGYPFNEEQYGTMLKTLKLAILEGHIPGKTSTAELLWIKGAFPL